jgi:hypothetical protein
VIVVGVGTSGASVCHIDVDRPLQWGAGLGMMGSCGHLDEVAQLCQSLT